MFSFHSNSLTSITSWVQVVVIRFVKSKKDEKPLVLLFTHFRLYPCSCAAPSLSGAGERKKKAEKKNVKVKNTPPHRTPQQPQHQPQPQRVAELPRQNHTAGHFRSRLARWEHNLDLSHVAGKTAGKRPRRRKCVVGLRSLVLKESIKNEPPFLWPAPLYRDSNLTARNQRSYWSRFNRPVRYRSLPRALLLERPTSHTEVALEESSQRTRKDEMWRHASSFGQVEYYEV